MKYSENSLKKTLPEVLSFTVEPRVPEALPLLEKGLPVAAPPPIPNWNCERVAVFTTPVVVSPLVNWKSRAKGAFALPMSGVVSRVMWSLRRLGRAR
jgi:hypothetical protein